MKFENDDNFLLSKLLQKEQSIRPRVREIIDTPWFNDPKLKALNFVMNLESNDLKKYRIFRKITKNSWDV